MVYRQEKLQRTIFFLSLDKYNQLTKAARNAEYLAMIDRGIAQLSAGKGQKHDLIEEDDE
jgi:antitoxin YefM